MAAAVMKWFDDEMVNHPGYPLVIQLPHAIWAASAFRDMHEPGEKVSWLQPIVGGYFCHGYGGTCTRDLIMGAPPAFVGHRDVPMYWMLGYIFAYHSPFDYVYKAYSTPRHPIRVALRFVEAVDVAITLPGTFEKGAKAFPEAMAAGPALAMCSVYGGALFRYLYNKGRGQNPKVEWCNPGGPTRRGITYTLFYMWARTNLGIPKARMFITIFHCVWELLQEFMGSFDPFELIFNNIGAFLKMVATTLNLNMERTKLAVEEN